MREWLAGRYGYSVAVSAVELFSWCMFYVIHFRTILDYSLLHSTYESNNRAQVTQYKLFPLPNLIQMHLPK